MADAAGSAPPRMEAYRVRTLGAPLPHKVESITAYRALVFVGTSDSRVLVYRIGAATGAAAPLTLLHEVVDGRRQPVRLLAVVSARRLLALVGDVIVIYRIHGDAADAAASVQLREVTSITALKDVVSLELKQHRGLVSLAVLQRKRVTVYEASHASLDFLLKETVELPDGVRTLSWLGRSLLLGGRREYLVHHTASASTAALYAAPRSGAAPLLLPMAPVPEVLVASDGAGVRALLSDGSEVPGNVRVLWAHAPTALRYEHPYVVSLHPSAAPQTLQVRLPWLRSLGDTAAYPHDCLCQTLTVPKVVCMSQCHWTDYDCAMPSSGATADLLTHYPIIVSDADNRLHLLTRTPVAAQAESLAAARHFAAADLLCRLCPHEVAPLTLQRVGVAGALDKFLVQHDYVGCFHDLGAVEADPRVAVQLFPGYAAPGEEAVTLPVPPPTAVVPAALPAFIDYLQSQRTALLLLVPQGGDAAFLQAVPSQLRAVDRALVRALDRALLRAVDRALLRALCALQREAALLVLLHGNHRCDVDDAVALLREHRQWVALTLLLETSGRLEEAALELRRLAAVDTTAAAAAAPLPPSQVEVLRELFQRHPLPTSDGEPYVPQGTVDRWVASCPGAAALTAAETQALCALSTAAVTALSFLQRRPLEQLQRLLERDLSWLLDVVPASSAVRIFFSAENVARWGAVLQLLQSHRSRGRTTARQLLVVEYLWQLFADARARVTEPSAYERYWRGLGELLFRPATADVLPADERQRQRERLGEFLLTSPHVNLESAQSFFDARDVRALCRPERAAVYRRSSNHGTAIAMFLGEANSVDEAVAYATSVYGDGSGAAFTALLHALLRPSAGPPRVAEAVQIMGSCDGVDAAAVLPLLPDDTPFSAVSAFLLHALRASTASYHAAAIDSGVLSARATQGEASLLRLSARAVVLEDRMVCPVCQRRLRPDTVVAVYPNKVLLHQGCAADEHVCPATRRNFRHDAYAALEDL